jgi:dTDP-4-amino-4,6-dideoxy-D-galactose acyltransferase
VQAKIPRERADLLDALQQHGFQLVEGEVDLSITLPGTMRPARKLQRSRISPCCARWRRRHLPEPLSRALVCPDDSGRFYAQWIENAVKGTFDHVCLVFRAADGDIQGLSRCVSSMSARRVSAY